MPGRVLCVRRVRERVVEGGIRLNAVHAQWLTLSFLALVTFCVVAFDVWLTLRFGPDASISRVLCRLFASWPAAGLAVVFWLGLLVGHVWLPAG